jgi:8-oxo-dGTP pyrophosphatase MutT (NUDIX family)
LTITTDINHFARILKERLIKDLPGSDAQDIMAPSNRKELIELSTGSENARLSSILIILYPDNNGEVSIIFIKRVEYIGVHSGQIAFPGGKFESEDISLLHTALRETKEEIGLDIHENNVAGKLTNLYVPPSNYLISPYVAVIDQIPLLRPDSYEVAEAFSAPLSHFLWPEAMIVRSYRLASGIEIPVPGFTFGNHFIWGATAMIFSEFLQVIRDINKN